MERAGEFSCKGGYFPSGHSPAGGKRKVAKKRESATHILEEALHFDLKDVAKSCGAK